MLKERPWLGIQIAYSKRHALIAIEKGAPGERAFQKKRSPLGAGPDILSQTSLKSLSRALLRAPDGYSSADHNRGHLCYGHHLHPVSGTSETAQKLEAPTGSINLN
jgi:hypothetical protein